MATIDMFPNELIEKDAALVMAKGTTVERGLMLSIAISFKRLADAAQGAAGKAGAADALLPINLWGTFGTELFGAMPEHYREHIGRRAVQNASFISQLETINTSRVSRGEKPLSLSQFLAGTEGDE